MVDKGNILRSIALVAGVITVVLSTVMTTTDFADNNPHNVIMFNEHYVDVRRQVVKDSIKETIEAALDAVNEKFLFPSLVPFEAAYTKYINDTKLDTKLAIQCGNQGGKDALVYYNFYDTQNLWAVLWQAPIFNATLFSPLQVPYPSTAPGAVDLNKALNAMFAVAKVYGGSVDKFAEQEYIDKNVDELFEEIKTKIDNAVVLGSFAVLMFTLATISLGVTVGPVYKSFGPGAFFLVAIIFATAFIPLVVSIREPYNLVFERLERENTDKVNPSTALYCGVIGIIVGVIGFILTTVAAVLERTRSEPAPSDETKMTTILKE